MRFRATVGPADPWVGHNTAVHMLTLQNSSANDVLRLLLATHSMSWSPFASLRRCEVSELRQVANLPSQDHMWAYRGRGHG
jgi:hypothetical protein